MGPVAFLTSDLGLALLFNAELYEFKCPVGFGILYDTCLHLQTEFHILSIAFHLINLPYNV